MGGIKLRKLFSLNIYEDERVVALENKIYTEVSFIIFGIVCVDMLVRAVILDYPLREWIISFIIYIVYIFYMIYRHRILGINEQETLNSSQLKNYKLMEKISNSSVILYSLGYIFKTQGLPNNWDEWFKQIYILGIISIITFLISKILVNKFKPIK